MGLLVIRHGETHQNAVGILQGPRVDGLLSDRGRLQAAALAEALADVPLAAVYASPLRRARDTAQAIVARKGGHLAVHTVPELYEIDYGHLAGRQLSEVKSTMDQVVDAWTVGFPQEAFPGGESALVAQQRIRPTAERLVREAEAAEVAVVAHGHINRILLASVTGAGLASIMAFPQDNANITYVEVREGRGKAVRINDTRHLDAR